MNRKLFGPALGALVLALLLASCVGSGGPSGPAFFDHPAGELRWDGPDGGAVSVDVRRCETPPDVKLQYGVPALVRLNGDEFWFAAVIPRRDGWRLTGYYYEDWLMRQGRDENVIYLLHAAGDPDIAFEYRANGCGAGA